MLGRLGKYDNLHWGQTARRPHEPTTQSLWLARLEGWDWRYGKDLRQALHIPTAQYFWPTTGLRLSAFQTKYYLHLVLNCFRITHLGFLLGWLLGISRTISPNTLI